MKNLFACFYAALLSAALITPVPAANAAPLPEAPPTARSEAYILMDAETGQILASQNADQREYPASITKMLTIALALQDHKPTDRFEITQDVVDTIPRDSTHIALTDGERVNVGDMASVAMVESANDAAAALAQFDGETIGAFVDKMNAKAVELGALGTHFANPTGLHDPEHYTTAEDFAHILRWALAVPGFREVLATKEYAMEPTNKQSTPRQFGTHDCLIVESAYTYEGAGGGKLGWTPEAKHTYAAVAKRGNMELVFVSLKTEGKWDKFEDAVAMFNYGFDGFERLDFPNKLGYAPFVPVFDGETELGDIRLLLPESIPMDVPKGKTLEDVAVNLDVPGRYEADQLESISPRFVISCAGKELYTYPLKYERIGNDMPEDAAEAVKTGIHFKIDPVWVWRILGGLLVIAAVVIIWQLLAAASRRKRRRRERNRRLGRM